MVAGPRRQARERALGLLYEAEARSVSPADVLAELPVPPDPFTAELVKGVQDNQRDIDHLIERFAVDWALDRMPVIDLCLLRLAVFELCHQPETPVAAVISEAVELAKTYSTEQSGKFVNGMLSSVAHEVREASAP